MTPSLRTTVLAFPCHPAIAHHSNSLINFIWQKLRFRKLLILSQEWYHWNELEPITQVGDVTSVISYAVLHNRLCNMEKTLKDLRTFISKLIDQIGIIILLQIRTTAALLLLLWWLILVLVLVLMLLLFQFCWFSKPVL